MLLSLLACTPGETTEDTGGLEYWSQLAWANCRAEVDWAESLHAQEATSWYVYDEAGRLVDTFDSRGRGGDGEWQQWEYEGDHLVEHTLGPGTYYEAVTWRTTHSYEEDRLVETETFYKEALLDRVTYSYDSNGHVATETWEDAGGPAYLNVVTTDSNGRVTRVDRFDEPDDGEVDQWHVTAWLQSGDNTTWETESFHINAEGIWKIEGETTNQQGAPLAWWYELFSEGLERRGDVEYTYSEDLRLETRTDVWTSMSGSEDLVEVWAWTWDWTDEGFVQTETYDNRDRETWSGTWTWTCN